MKAYVPATAILLAIFFAICGLNMATEKDSVAGWIGALTPAALAAYMAFRITREYYKST
jgi:hypothetical protein